MRKPRTIPLLLLLAAALALAGCGGSARVANTSNVSGGTGGSGTSGATGPTAATTAPSTATVTTPLTVSTSTSTSPGASGACTAGDLAPSFLGSNGAAGHVVLGFALRNRSSAACHTYGFPGLALLDKGGGVVGRNPSRTTQDYVGSAPEQRITLQPGQEASFRVVTSDVTSGGESSCPSAAGAQIIAPDDTATMRVSFTPILDCGTPTVSPLESGTTAFPAP